MKRGDAAIILKFPERDATAERAAKAGNVVAVWVWRRGRWVRLAVGGARNDTPKRA
jgi:hypothetical protein